MDVLIGRKILNVEVDTTGDNFKIETDEGPFYFEAFADCCSSTYIEWVNHSCMIGATVLEVAEKKVPYNADFCCDEDDDDYSVASYGTTIKHTNGYTDVYSWNVSNGYYSGYLMYLEEPLEDSSYVWGPVKDWDQN